MTRVTTPPLVQVDEKTEIISAQLRSRGPFLLMEKPGLSHWIRIINGATARL